MSKPKSNKQKILEEAQIYYNTRPIDFFQDILKSELDEQQIEF